MVARERNATFGEEMRPAAAWIVETSVPPRYPPCLGTDTNQHLLYSLPVCGGISSQPTKPLRFIPRILSHDNYSLRDGFGPIKSCLVKNEQESVIGTTAKERERNTTMGGSKHIHHTTHVVRWNEHWLDLTAPTKLFLDTSIKKAVLHRFVEPF